jgi:cytochrome c556
MKTVFLCLLMLAGDDAARHKEWMDEAQDLKEDLRDALNAKSGAKAAEPASKLVQIGEREEKYWRDAKLHDIVKIAQQNLVAAREVAAAAKDGHFEEALLAFGRLETTCRACHDVHPEKRLQP